MAKHGQSRNAKWLYLLDLGLAAAFFLGRGLAPAFAFASADARDTEEALLDFIDLGFSWEAKLWECMGRMCTIAQKHVDVKPLSPNQQSIQGHIELGALHKILLDLVALGPPQKDLSDFSKWWPTCSQWCHSCFRKQRAQRVIHCQHLGVRRPQRLRQP